MPREAVSQSDYEKRVTLKGRANVSSGSIGPGR